MKWLPSGVSLATALLTEVMKVQSRAQTFVSAASLAHCVFTSNLCVDNLPGFSR